VNKMNQNKARDSCSVAAIIRDRLQAAARDRLYARAGRYRDMNHTMLSLAHSNALLRRTCQLGYHGAAKRLTRRVNRFTDHLCRELDGLPAQNDSHEIPTQGQLAGELRQIEDEFDEWKFEARERVLSVTTEAIHLDSVYLGPFSIELELDPLANFAGQTGSLGHHPFKIIALDPQPAAGKSHVTHPHVSDERLCTGESAHSVSSALSEGRLADFFLIVRGLLQTYNPESPYVALDVWSGTSCHECGERIREDDRYHCEICEHDVCNGCMSSCAHCGDSSCYGCLINCKHCEEYHCDDCMKLCSECDQACCADCLEDGLCPDCVDNKENQQDDLKNAEEQSEARLEDESKPVETAPVEATATL
jgi:hypothetical protein